MSLRRKKEGILSLDLSVEVRRAEQQPIFFHPLNNGPLLPNVLDSQSTRRKVS